MDRFSKVENKLRKLGGGNAVNVDMFEACVHRARSMINYVEKNEAIEKLVSEGIPEDIATYAVVAAEIINNNGDS